jgi:hypothetical protein
MCLRTALPDDNLQTRPKHVALLNIQQKYCSLDVRKCEIFLEMQQHKGMIFNNIAIYVAEQNKTTQELRHTHACVRVVKCL